jgi:uncharacterized surface anchored protein
MKYKIWVRALALMLLLALMVSAVPAVFAAEDTEPTVAEAALEQEATEEAPEEEPDEIEEPEPTAPLGEDDESLTRTDIMPIAASGLMGKSTCVDFAQYTSNRWYCNRYHTTGSHSSGHYFYATSIAYHTVDGELTYCVEPNVTSLSGQYYSGYQANSAASSSYWMLELDSTQRSYIQQILAFGYPSIDRGYSKQVQYAATQTLIWEVVSKVRYSSIQSCTNSGLYSKIYAVLGSDYQKCYDGILASISISNGKVPSFASSSSSSPATVQLTLNTSTNCYEATVTDTNAVNQYFTFTQSGVTFTKSGNSLKISVPTSSAASVKGQTIIGTSSQMNMSTSNPTIWENSSYQTVLSSGGAEYMKAYIRLNWEDTGSIKLTKKVSDSAIGVSGWSFYFKNDSTGETIEKTTGADGTITLSGLTAGTKYTVSEKSYDGYYQPSAQAVTIEAGKNTELTFTNKPLTGNLTVSKAVNYGTWEGFKFRLYGTSTIGKSVDVTVTTDSSGKATFSGIYVGTYTLEEISPGDQYVTPTSQAVTITAGENSMTATNVWKHWSATVTKVDADTSSAQGNATLDGAEYTLYKSGKAVATYTVKNGKFTTDSFPCTESDSVYTLKETKAPTGYTLDETVYKLTTSYSHYSNAENSIALTVSDTVIQGKIQPEKWAINTVSGDKQAENGATFAVYLKSAGSYAKAKDSEKDIITIGADGKGVSKNLPYGTYCIQQVSGWDGYDLDTNVYEAAITKNGVTVTKDTAGKALTIYNNIWTGTLTICKVDGDTQAPLPGAVFTLSGSDGSSVVLTTDSEGKAIFENLVYGVTYTWAETAAPKGYLLDEANTGTWTVTEQNAAVEITCENVRRPGSITVTKQDASGEALSGCTFLLEYLDGTEWKPVTARSSDPITQGGCTSPNLENGCLTTDESGTVTFSGLWADSALQYRLTEVSAPEGYALLSEPVFEGTLPVAHAADQVSAQPDETIDQTAYFYDLPVTVRDGKIYTLPTTGGGNFPFVPLGILVLSVGGFLIFRHKYPYIFKNFRRFSV